MIAAADGRGRTNLFEAIADQAAQATRRQLKLLLGLALIGAAAASRLFLSSPVVAFTVMSCCGSVACLSLWEMAGRTRKVGYSLRMAARRLLAVVGIALIVGGVMAFLVAILGRSWQS